MSNTAYSVGDQNANKQNVYISFDTYTQINSVILSLINTYIHSIALLRLLSHIIVIIQSVSVTHSNAEH